MIETVAIEGLLVITPRRTEDVRGYFVETYNQGKLAQFGFDAPFVQDNVSLSKAPGTLRGLHFQTPPFAQDKLVRVLRGAIVDVAVDLRSGSETFGKHFSIELTAENGRQLLVPVGFAHGFCTLQPDTEVAYKVTAHYAPQNDAGLRWNDPDLSIAWPVEEPVLSDRDARLPFLSEFSNPF